jgi:hypothetical protein
MADSPSATGSSPAESPAQAQARLRRERRAAKIQGGGASRLQAISSLQGGTHRDVEKDVPGTTPRRSFPAGLPLTPNSQTRACRIRDSNA